MPAFAILAAGHDRPGIVAAVTAGLVELGVNLADTSMVSLRGTFAMVLVVDAPAGVDAAGVEAALRPAASALDLAISVRPASDVPEAQADWAHRQTLTVHGADRAGIVHGITARLAAHGANVVDLETHVVGPAGAPVYAMVIDVDVPAGVDVEALRADLDEAAATLGVSCTLRPVDADIL